MRMLRSSFIAAAFAATLASGCSQGGSAALNPVDTDPKAVEAMVTKLTTETFKGKATAAADLAAVRDALPKEVSLSWANLSFDQAAGATVLTGVKLAPTDMPSIGIGIDELRLFDFDADFAKARLSGQRLTETASLASRIDAKGVSVFGLADMMNGIVGAVPTKQIIDQPPEPSTDPGQPGADDDQPSGWPPETEPQLFDDSGWGATSSYGPKFDKYDISYGRIVLNDVVLRPFEMTPAKTSSDPSDPFALMMPMLQPMAAIMRSFGVDAMAMTDLKGEIAFSEMGQSMSGAFGMKSSGLRGWRGGDIDAAYVRDVSFNMNGGASAAQSVQGTVGRYTIEDMRLDKVYAAFAKGVLPPRTETDVMSLGLIRVENQNWNIGGREVYSVGEYALDARKFHWFIPTDLRLSASNVAIDIGNVMKLGEQMADEFGGMGYQDPSAPDMKTVMAALEKYGLSKPVMNFNLGWNWNADSGDARVDLGFGADKFMQVDTKYEGGFPSFKAVSDLIPDNVENTNAAALENLFDAKSTMKLVDINIVDKGGLTALFGISSELAPGMMGGMGMGADGSGAVTPETMRTLTATFIRAMAEQSSAQMPEMAALMNPLAAFVGEGGKLHFMMQPAKPLPFSAMESSMFGTNVPPSQAMKELGIKLEHSK